LEGHRLGETEAAREELLHTFQDLKRRLVDLDHMERLARLRGSWCLREVSGSVHQKSDAVSAVEGSARRTCRGQWMQRCPRRGGYPQAANKQPR